MDASDPRPAQRAADADRESAAEALRHAGGDGRLSVEEMEERLTAVYAAKTHVEIDLLLADLHGHQDLARRPLTRPAPPRPTGTGPEVSRSIAIMGESKRRGFWRPAAETQVLTVMGENLIDLTEAELSRQITHLRVLTIMGETRVEVPDDVNVHVSKVTIMAENDVDTPYEQIPGAPELHIHLISIMGEAKVRFSARRRRRRSELEA